MRPIDRGMNDAMKKLIFIIVMAIAVSFAYVVAEDESSQRKSPTFEDAISIIKQFEGFHGSRHWPFVGYGHLVMRGEKFKRGKVLSEEEADALVREDYAKLCARYREFGADSLLLAALAYNCGPGVVAKSSVFSKLKAGIRDIESAYLAHCRYKGKQLKQLKRRRETELATLFVKYPETVAENNTEITKQDEEGNTNDSTIVYAVVDNAADGMQ